MLSAKSNQGHLLFVILSPAHIVIIERKEKCQDINFDLMPPSPVRGCSPDHPVVSPPVILAFQKPLTLVACHEVETTRFSVEEFQC